MRALAEGGGLMGQWRYLCGQLRVRHVQMCVCSSNDCFPVFFVLLIPEWHQYDDIVCAKLSVVKNLWHMVSRNGYKDVVEGKKIAANIMLESIFSILGTWSSSNLRGFIFQLRQFYVVTREPWVFDGEEMPWMELNFGPEQVIFSFSRYRKTGVWFLTTGLHFCC